MNYRKDIQMIRGVAVLLVVLFHLELPGLSSGFLGVDAFFVVSGFLMAVLYDPSDKKEFFLRRARRLLPAYYVTVFVVLIVSTLWVLPVEHGQVVKQSIYSSLFASNIGYWLANSYFSKVEFTPLLHLWSLGVEIQFYLIVPLLFYIFRKIKGSFTLVLLGSLALCFVVVSVSPKTSFFMMPLRLWEFLIGVGVVRLFTNGGNVKLMRLRWLGLLGLLGITLIPFLSLNGSAQSWVVGHPGLHALGICLATASVLAFGLPYRVEHSRLGSFLEWLGKYSYSIYLVHFPIIVLVLYQPFSGTLLKGGGWDTALALSLAAVFSVLMYKYVEGLKKPFSFKWIPAVPVIVVLLVLAGNQYQEVTYSSKEKFIFEAWDDRSFYRCGKSARIRDPFAVSLELTNGERDQKVVMLIGNSHADSIKATFVSVAEKNGVRVRFVVNNAPLMPGGPSPKLLADDVVRNNVSSVVVHFSPKGADVGRITEFVELLKSEGVDVSFIMPVPVWEGHVPELLYNNLIHGAPLPVQTPEQYRKDNLRLHAGVQSIELQLYEVEQYFIDSDTGSFRLTTPQGKPLYFDDGHLTLTGSAYLKPLFEEIIEKLKQKGAEG